MPDIIKLKARSGKEYFPGHLYYSEYNAAVFPKTTDAAELFMCIEHLKPQSYNEVVKGFIVTPDMLFETETDIPDVIPMHGDRIQLSNTDNNGACGLYPENDSASPAVVEDLAEHQNTLTITVSFKPERETV